MSVEKARADRLRAAEKLCALVPGVQVDFDEALGSPKFIVSTSGFLAAPDGLTGAVPAERLDRFPAEDPQRIVKAFLDEHAAMFGHGSSVLNDARLVRDYQTSHNGLRTYVWQQQLEGIRIFESTLQAHVTKDGSLVNVGSRLIPNAPAAAKTGSPQYVAKRKNPTIPPKVAIAEAAKTIGETVALAQIAESSAPEGPAQKQQFRSTQLLEISTEEVYFPIDETTLHLAWEVIFTSKARGEMFRAIIDAESGAALVLQGLTEYISNASYRVWTSDSPSPFSPGHPTPLTTQPAVVARTLVTLDALNTTASPNGWIDDGVNELRGNNVDAHTDLNADNVADTPRPTGLPNRVFDFPVDLSQAPTSYSAAAVTDLFYWNNLIHDRYYQLGFTEAAGNFQNNNFGRGGFGNDAVQADAQDGSGTNNANFSTPADGSPGRMQMYVFSGPTPDRDGDFDHEIVIHEYTHGLSNRLVGGGVGMSALQSRGMGEGWSDFYALCLLSEPTDDPNAVYAKGGYATYQLSGQTQNYYFGIRRYPYSTDLTKNPLTFKDIDPVQASPHTGVPRSAIIGNTADAVHNQGELWCVTLWEARANLIARHGATAGNNLMLQLVTDGMKLAPANPNFLQARNGIIQADLVNNGGANFGALWGAFAKRGMGSSATSPSSSTTAGVVENYSIPDDLSVTPSAAWAVNGMVGGPFTATNTYTLLNSGTSSLNWTAAKTQPWLDLSSTGGTLAPGATATVTASLSAAALNLTSGTYSGTINFTNTTSGVAQSRAVTLTVEPFTVMIASETWESGSPGSAWTITGTNTHRTLVTTANEPHGGTRHLTMDSSTDLTLSRNEATWTVNLAGRTDVQLRFWVKMFSDEANGPPASPFVGGADFDGVAISADGTNWYEVQPLRTLVSAWTRYTVDLDAAIAARGLSYNSSFKIRFNHYDDYPITTDGFAFDDIELISTSSNLLTLNLPASANESAGTLSGSVTVTPAPASSLTVALASNQPTQASVPASVVVPAGQSSATFTVTVTDDTLLDGTQPVTITATAAGYANGTRTISVEDNETATLTLTLPATANEGAGTIAGTVRTSAAPAANILVTLASSNPAEVAPMTVTIPAGQTSANFNLAITDDARIDGTVTTTITAQVANWTPGSASINIADNESSTLVVNLPASAREGDAPISGSVQISGTLPSALAVSLGSNDQSELTVPTTVTIAAGQTSATFSATVINDTDADGAQNAIVTASAPGFVNGTDTVSVQDNDAHHFVFGTVGVSQVPNVPFAVSVSARDLNNVVIPSFNSPVPLTAAGAGGALAVTPSTLTGWVSGVWTGNVTIGASGTGVALTANDGNGHTGTSNTFNVAVGALHHFGWAPIASPQTRDTLFPVTITAQDAGNNPVTSFNGTASLSTAPASGVQILSWTGYADTSTSGEYQNAKQAISTYFPGYTETSTTVTDPAQLAAALNGKHVFLIPEQESAGTGAMGSLGTAWATVLTNFVSNGGVVIVCSWSLDEHLVLVNSGLMTATKGGIPSSASVTKTADTPLNANVATPFAASYVSEYSASNGVVSLHTVAGSPVVLSRAVGTGHAVLIGTDFFTLGTGMDRIIANAVQLATVTGNGIPILPSTSGNFVNGVWAGNVAVPFTSSSVKLRATAGAGLQGDSNAFLVQAPTDPPVASGTVLSEPFEDPTLGPWWTITGTSNFRTQLTTANTPHGGAKHLTMDSSSDGTYARNEATLTVNLAARTGVVLTFWAKGFNDEGNGPPPIPFSGGYDFDGVAISADGTNWYEVQALRTLTGTYTQFTVNLDAAIAARGLSYNSTFKIRFNQFDDFGITTDGIAIDDILLTANALPSVLVAVPAQANENAGPLTGSVTLPAAATSNTTVTLASSANAKVSVPASVMVPTGQVSASFTLTVLDNTLLDGNRDVTITATSPGGGVGSANILIVENDVTTLTLTAPASTTEGATGVTATATLGATPAGAITFNAISNDPSEITVPATVTFPPGQNSIAIPLTVIDDTLIDGSQNAMVTLSATGWTSASRTIAVQDNETALLALSFATTVTEGNMVTGTVSISGTLPSALVVALGSSDATQLSVPTNVTIPAGLTSATFTLTAVNDTLPEITQAITITASAGGFTQATRNISVIDNDPHHFAFAAITGPKNTGVPFGVTITAQDVNNVTIANFIGTAALTAAGTGGSVALTPANTGSFVSGVWTGNVTCTASGTGVRLTATAGTVTGTSGAFDVSVPPAITLTPPSVTLTLNQGETTTRTVAIGNTGGSTLTWSIASSATLAEVVSAEPAVEGHAVVAKNEPARKDPASILTVPRVAEASIESAGAPALAAALANLNVNSGLVRAVIPSRYSFSEGVTGSSIGDGGDDMYDGGNSLGTNLGILAYSDNVIASSALLGTGGQYFTRKYDGLWVFAADVSALTYFEITGNLGADGGGSTDSAVLSVVREGITFRGFVKRVYSTSDPSVNHLIIAADNGSMTHAVSTDTNDDYHRLTNLSGVTRLYHVLYAGTSGAYIDNTATLAIMTAFLDAISTPDFVTFSPTSGTVAAGAAQNVSLTISAAGLAQGTYSRTLLLTSNDPTRPQTSLPVTLNVLGVANLSVTPTTGFTANGSRTGPFNPLSQAFTLTNVGGQPLNWTAAKAAPWLDLSSSGGALNPGQSVTVTATLNTAANSLASGPYSDTLTFANTSNGIGNTTRPVALTVNPVGELAVTPAADLDASGPLGGPFTPAEQAYTLTNPGDAPLNWTASKSASWLTLSPTAGTLAPGASATVTATITGTTLNPGDYDDSIVFTNTSSGRGNTSRSATLTVVLPAPVLAPEPPITPATSNTVAWSPIAGADAYGVEISTSHDFGSPLTSGWISGTSHTFSTLSDGQDYFYRVRARRFVDKTIGGWSQTSEAEFNTCTLATASATSGGEVILANAGGSEIPGRILNPSFEANLVGSTSASNWTTQSSGTMGVYIYDSTLAVPLPTQGTRFLLLWAQWVTHTAGEFVGVRQSVDLTGAHVVAFDASLTKATGIPWGSSIKGELLVDGIARWTETLEGPRPNQMVDVSDLTGIHTVEFRCTVIKTGDFQSQWFCVDNIRALAPAGTYYPSGSLVSPAIAPADWKQWGTLRFSRNAAAPGTALTVDVLNASGSLLAANVSSGTNLDGIAAIANQPSIRLRGNLSTTNNANTPRLEDWSVEYFTALDQTFLSAWSNVETSTQFNSPPGITAIGSQQFIEDGTTGPLTFALSDDTTLSDNLAVTVSSTASSLIAPQGLQLGGAGAARTVTVTPLADAHGQAIVTIRASDEGGKFSESSFPVVVLPVNDAPVFAKGPDQTVRQNAGPQTFPAWATSVAPGPPNEADQALDFLITVDHPELFTAPPSIASDGTLTFTPSAAISGTTTVTVRLHDGGGTENGGIDTSSPQTFIITTTFVNDAPSFVAGASLEIAQNAGPQTVPAWAKNIQAGPADEVNQALDFRVTVDNAALFSIPPAITADGTLTFTPAAEISGTAIVTVRLHDGAGTENDGSDLSAPQTFTISTTFVNDAPSFVGGANIQVAQNAGPQSIPAWAKNILAGPADETSQTLDFQVTVTNTTLFATPPAIAANGTLTFTPSAETSGTTTVTVRLHDGGGTENGGIDTSAPQVFVISTSFVNDAPSFAAGASIEIAQNAGPQTIPAWAKNIRAGPADEESQTLDFRVTVDNAALFTTPPAIATDGTLTYTPAPKASGTAIVTVELHDNGGVAEGGKDSSLPKTFTIAVTTFAEEPGSYNGLVRAADNIVRSADHHGLIGITIGRQGIFTGKVTVGGKMRPVRGAFDLSGVAHFGASDSTTWSFPRKGRSALQMALSLDVARGSDSLTGTLLEDGQPFAVIAADRALFTMSRKRKAPFLDMPEHLLGAYTAVFATRLDADAQLQVEHYPSGSGVASLRILGDGRARITATLANGTKFSYANLLSKGHTWPLYHAPRGGGAITGMVNFRATDGISDLDGPDLLWFCPAAKGEFYPNGWPAGIRTDLVGSKYLRPLPGAAIIPGLSAANPNGNAMLHLSKGGLADGGIEKALSIGNSFRASAVAPNSESISLIFHEYTGLFEGLFKHPVTRKWTRISGAVMQKQSRGAGWFRTHKEAGGVLLFPEPAVAP